MADRLRPWSSIDRPRRRIRLLIRTALPNRPEEAHWSAPRPRGSAWSGRPLGAGATTQGRPQSARVPAAGVLRSVSPRLHRAQARQALSLRHAPLVLAPLCLRLLLEACDAWRRTPYDRNPRTTAERQPQPWPRLFPPGAGNRVWSAYPPTGQTHSGTDPDPPLRGKRVGVRRPALQVHGYDSAPDRGSGGGWVPS